MTHNLVEAKGYLIMTAASGKHSISSESEASSSTSSEGKLAVHLRMVVEPVIPAPDGTVQREVDRRAAAASAAATAGGNGHTQPLNLELTLPQAFHLLSELEELQAALAAADR